MTDPGQRGWRLVRARPDAIPASVRRFNARARAHRIRSARPWLVAAGITVLVGALTYVVYGTSLFGVDQVRVVGAGFIGTGDVRTAAAIADGTPLASVDTAVVASRVERLPGVAHASVSRDWPSTIVIAVTPRTAVAAVPVNVPGGRRYVLLDRTGIAFRTVDVSPSGLIPISLADPGPDDPATISALSVLASLPSPIRDQLATINAPGPAQIELMLSGGREIIWGDASENMTKGSVATTLLHRPGTVIDVSAPNVVTVR